MCRLFAKRHVDYTADRFDKQYCGTECRDESLFFEAACADFLMAWAFRSEKALKQHLHLGFGESDPYFNNNLSIRSGVAFVPSLERLIAGYIFAASHQCWALGVSSELLRADYTIRCDQHLACGQRKNARLFWQCCEACKFACQYAKKNLPTFATGCFVQLHRILS